MKIKNEPWFLKVSFLKLKLKLLNQSLLRASVLGAFEPKNLLFL